MSDLRFLHGKCKITNVLTDVARKLNELCNKYTSMKRVKHLSINHMQISKI